MPKPKSICVFGDSMTWGAWDLEKVRNFLIENKWI